MKKRKSKHARIALRLHRSLVKLFFLQSMKTQSPDWAFYISSTKIFLFHPLYLWWNIKGLVLRGCLNRDSLFSYFITTSEHSLSRGAKYCDLSVIITHTWIILRCYGQLLKIMYFQIFFLILNLKVRTSHGWKLRQYSTINF